MVFKHNSYDEFLSKPCNVFYYYLTMFCIVEDGNKVELADLLQSAPKTASLGTLKKKIVRHLQFSCLAVDVSNSFLLA